MNIFKALAFDYDGTLASRDRIGAETLGALAAARAAGLILILATGRTFFELTRVCERLDLFDAVVAENGGVIYYPRSGILRNQAPPPPPRLLAELDRRSVYYQAGHVVIGTARRDEDRVREALDSAGVSLDRVYNRAALMLLPAGISKGTGVEQVLRHFGLSFHDVLALGDSENDLDLFQACGWSGCPTNAVSPVMAAADWIFPGEDGESMARAITGPILQGLLAVTVTPRHRIELGWVAGTSAPVTLPARGVNVLIHGDPHSGKSWLAGALVERLHADRYAVCIIDPEGDYRVLERLPGVVWAEIKEEGALRRAFQEFERDPAACVVADLSALPHGRKVGLIGTALALVHDLRRRRGFPHWVFLDEAHYSLHAGGVATEALGLDGKGFCLATYRPSWLRGEVTRAVDVLVLARTTDPAQLAFLRSFLGAGGRGELVVAVLPALPLGEFVVVEPIAEEPALTFVASPRMTPHVRHLRKYADSVVPPESRFLFRAPDGRLVATAESLSGFRTAVAEVGDDVLAHHAGHGDFSRWVRDVFSDPDLATQMRKTESRWARGEISDLRCALDRLITARYPTEG